MSLPGRVVQLRDGMAEVDVDGRRRWFNALLVPEVKLGAWVLTHTSLVIAEISESDAETVNALLRETAQLSQ